MPVFTFTGTDPQGKKVAGERLADTKAAVTMQLRRERITPGAIKEKGKKVPRTNRRKTEQPTFQAVENTECTKSAG